MAFLWGSSTAQTEFDALLEKTTSDLLPSSTPVDLSLSLQLADLIRSASIPPSSSSKSLLKRLQHSNPNVQLLTLQVLDVCIKNGGTPFLLQISDKDKEFYQHLESLATASSSSSSSSGNRDVREKTLEKLQEWAVAFKQKDSLRETQLVKIYDRLKAVHGVEFPNKDPIATAAMVDSLSAPEWQDSSYCTRCRTDFSTFNRKHHCRNCGQVFDQACSSQTSTLPHYGITQLVRVCDSCHKKIKEGKGSEVARNQSIKGARDGKSHANGRTKSSSSRKELEEEDLRKAIEASLKDSSSQHSHGPLRDGNSAVTAPKSSGYNPSYAGNFGGRDSKNAGGDRGGRDQEDADLAAAIAASLRDVQPPPTAPSFNRQDSNQAVTYSDMFPSTTHRPTFPSSSSYSGQSEPTVPRFKLPSYDLDRSQLAQIEQFTSTFTYQHPGPSYLTPPEHELANRTVRELQPRLDRSLEDTKTRGSILKELEWKLGEAARLYGAGLTEFNHNVYHASKREGRHQQQYSAPAAQYADNPQYQYHPTGASLVGQPLPDYAIPQPPTEFANSPDQAPPQQQRPEQAYRDVPVTVASPTLRQPHHPEEEVPKVADQEPWRLQQEEEQRRRHQQEEESKIGELIQF